MDLVQDTADTAEQAPEAGTQEQMSKIKEELTANAMRLGEVELTLVHFNSTMNLDGNFALHAVFVDAEKKQYEFSQLQSPEWHKKIIEDFSTNKEYFCQPSQRVTLVNFRPKKKVLTQPEISSTMN